MSDINFGELKKLNMRKAWPTEAQDFTPWLEKNITALGGALGMTLHSVGREVPIGGFSLDLLAYDDHKRMVAIENQFGQTDHDHLGKCLTYAAGCDADVIVWVTEEVRDEHRATVEWLNRKTDTDTEFYLVKVEVLQINKPPVAYQFIPVVAPNKWQKQAHQATAGSHEDATCGEYFRQFIGELKENRFQYDVALQHRDSTSYRYFSTGVRRWFYAHHFNDGEALVYLALNERKAVMDVVHNALRARKSKIEKIWGVGHLDWDDWKEWGTIGVSRPAAFSDDKKLLNRIRKWSVGQMLKLAEAIPPAMLQEIAAKLDAEESAE